jgi:hypothetical protein
VPERGVPIELMLLLIFDTTFGYPASAGLPIQRIRPLPMDVPTRRTGSLLD